ncbi:hypothetical protein K3495_g12703 [Podosphaera aphanis]|nr:hypothetical protein K3495_g12703 [Podosphaera aphanis]
MQPHLLTFTLSSALSLLFFASISASHNGLTKRYPTKGGGYRCGNIILSQDFIDGAAQQAASWPHRDLTQDSYGEISIHPVKYKGNLKFLADSELWLWPLSPIGQQSLDADSYYIVLETFLLKTVGVIWQHGDNLYERCIKESDLSDLLGNNFALGYRCPHMIYPLGIITRALLNSKRLNTAHFVGENIFDEAMSFFRWRIPPDVNLEIGASDYIIVDNKSNLVGMVYKRRKRYFRCRLTIKNQITPEFVGRALEQEPTIVKPQSLDVFHCQKYFIRSDQILVAVADGHKIIKWRMEMLDYRGYPLFYKTTGDSGSTVLYLWPIKISGEGLFYQTRFTNVENIFAVIDAFTNIHNVIIRVGENELVDCERKTVDRILYESRLSLFLRRITGIKASISKVIAEQSDHHRALAAGEIGSKSSTRPHKKQKLTTQ